MPLCYIKIPGLSFETGSSFKIAILKTLFRKAQERGKRKPRVRELDIFFKQVQGERKVKIGYCFYIYLLVWQHRIQWLIQVMMSSGHMYSWGIKGFNTPQSVCSKTTLITSSASVAGVNPSPRKMDTFFSQVLGCYCVNLQTFPIKWSQLAKYQTSQEFFSYNRALYKFFCSTFYTSPVGSI